MLRALFVVARKCCAAVERSGVEDPSLMTMRTKIRALSFTSFWLCATALTVFATGCASESTYIRGTRVDDTSENRTIIGVVERYRLAVERKDAPALMKMAAKSYWEDGGTPTGADDYGYDGLREVLVGRFQRADDIRYSMKYVKVRRQGQRAYVEVVVDASYTITTSNGEQRMDQRDQNQLVLEWDGEHWMFVSGM
jgi:hypothetical protein